MACCWQRQPKPLTALQTKMAEREFFSRNVVACQLGTSDNCRVRAICQEMYIFSRSVTKYFDGICWTDLSSGKRRW